MTASAYAPMACRMATAQDGPAAEVERRISRTINEYSQQGFHRTGTTVDRDGHPFTPICLVIGLRYGWLVIRI
jgi:hypothetical protein